MKEVSMKKSTAVTILVMVLAGLVISGFSGRGAEDPLQKHSESIERLESQVQSIKEDLESVKGDITELQKTLASVNARLISLTGKVSPVSKKFEEMQESYRGKLADLTRRLESIEKEGTAGRIEIDKSNWMRWKIQAGGNIYGDFTLSVDMKQVEGTPGYYGLLFRFSGENLYYFWVRDDGYYGLSLGRGEEWEVLIEMARAEPIRRSSWNKLAVEALGGELSLYANGELLGSVVDDRVSEGKVAVVSETASNQDYLKILFSDFSIKKLS
jgi:outer membrane murein-binding lipoprotein Lpp